MPITCIIIDDEPLALRLLETYINKMDELILIQAFEDALSAKVYLENNWVDLILLDIDMPDLNGIDLIKALDKKPLFIFTTAYKDYALEGFELEAVDFLLKPFNFDRFHKAIERVDKQLGLKRNSSSFLSVYTEYRLVNIDVSTIEYIEGMEDYVKIHLSNGQCIITLSTLKGILNRLSTGNFLRVHRSYIVCLDKIISLKSKKLQLPSVEITVGNSYLASLRTRLHH